ncbi:MAG: RND transporter MFP subunit [Melioribacteraceae bacterium]|nr:MAG: RND transporter MFP subunit [Melioribacteraceae bacterium]
MEQLQAEKGIPVEVEAVKAVNFVKYLSYFGTLEGYRQSTVGAMTGGRIEKVSIKAGDRVKKDQVVIEFPDDLPSSQVVQAKAAFDIAEKTYNRMKKLLEAGETSQANFDGAETQYLVAKRNYESAMEVMYVQAPYDGTITGVMVNKGDGVKAEAPLFTIANLAKMKVKVWATSKEIDKISKGSNAKIIYNGKEAAGKVTEVDLSMNPGRQAFGVTVVFENSLKLPAGVTADVLVQIYSNDDAIVVPRNIVQSDSKGNFVYVEIDGKSFRKYIKTGEVYDISMEVFEGLVPGDKLIVKGVENVLDSSTVNVIK